MAVVASADLVEMLGRHRLLEPARLEEVATRLQPAFPEPRALARELIQRDWLTPYQVNQIFQGRAQDLELGQYVLLERLGEGAIGQVFKARHRSLGRVVALKIIRKERLARPEVVKRFEREVQAAAQLKHPNVVLAFDADQVNGVHYIAMEYVEGIDLSRLVKTRGPLPVEQACEYVRQAALGLQHAHERGLVHRDIKPANLFVTQLGGMGGRPAEPERLGSGRPVVKILDLGLARPTLEAEGEAGGGVTQVGVVLGTVDYISPEQAMNASTVDIRTDIYSLGCTLYYLLTGRVPFGGTTAMEKLLKHRCEEPPAVESLRPEVAPALADLIRKMMAKRPEDRFQSPVEVASALADLAAQRKLSQAPPAPAALPRAIPVPAAQAGPALPQAILIPVTEETLPPGGGLQETTDPWNALPLEPAADGISILRRRSEAGKRFLVVGLIVAGVVILAVVILLILFLVLPRKRADEHGPGGGTSQNFAAAAGGSSRALPTSPKRPEKRFSESPAGPPPWSRFS